MVWVGYCGWTDGWMDGWTKDTIPITYFFLLFYLDGGRRFSFLLGMVALRIIASKPLGVSSSLVVLRDEG
jgi:hypothetical protein